MIELAPHNPYGLAVQTPILARAGIEGAGVERLANTDGIGAVISDPLGAAEYARADWQELPAGVLWPDQQRRIERARRDRRQWSRVRVPVIVALVATDAIRLHDLLAEIDDDQHAALLLDLTPLADRSVAAELIQIVRRRWLQPLLIEVATDQAWAVDLAAIDAVVLARGPRAAVVQHNDLVSGRGVGPATHPLLLAALGKFVPGEHPVIAGAATVAHAQTLLAHGATAVLLDVGLWHTPDLAVQIAAHSVRAEQDSP